MRPPEREYRILDKDLGRITNAEHAALALARPRLRLGLALLFMAVVAEIGATMLAGQPALGIVAASIAVARAKALCLRLGRDQADDIADSITALADCWESPEAQDRIRAFLGQR